MKKKLVNSLASTLAAYQNCLKTKNNAWVDKHSEKLIQMINKYMPHGGGFDAGITIDLKRSRPDFLVFHFSFHYMNEDGYYDGWYDYTLTVKPSLVTTFELYLNGVNHNGIKEYFYDTFDAALRHEIDDTTTISILNEDQKRNLGRH